MPRCVTIKAKRRKVCAGELNELIVIQTRDIEAPDFEGVDFAENFAEADGDDDWAMIETVSGKTLFDGVSTDINITHNFYIRFDENVTAENWILFESRRFDILDVENFEERNEFMKLICNERGSSTKAAASA